MVMGSGGGSRLCARSTRAGGSSIRGEVLDESALARRALRTEFGEGNNHTPTQKNYQAQPRGAGKKKRHAACPVLYRGSNLRHKTETTFS